MHILIQYLITMAGASSLVKRPVPEYGTWYREAGRGYSSRHGRVPVHNRSRPARMPRASSSTRKPLGLA